jgi:SAM-dependent methyltransferase
MSRILQAIRSFRAWVFGLTAVHARIDQLTHRLDTLPRSARRDGKSPSAADNPLAGPRTPRANGAIRIVFLAQHPSVWPSWRSVWAAAARDPRFSVKVVLTRFIHPFSSQARTYDDMKQCLMDEGVPFCTDAYFDAESFVPHVAFVQNPYDETRPENFRVEQLQQAGTRTAYIPYGLEIGGGAWNFKAQFDTEVHRSAWRIFVRSERSRAMYAKYCRAGNSHVAVTGHPKFDAAKAVARNELSSAVKQKVAGRKLILWTPHFSVGDPPTWSTFESNVESILEEMSRRQDLFLLIRPHPMLFKAMRQKKLWDAQAEEAFRLRIEAAGNLALDESADYHAAFAAADALMADIGSFLLEFLPTGKPLMYLHCKGGLGMNDDGELVNHLYVGTEQADIAKFIEMVARGEDPRKAERAKALPEFLFGLELETSAGERICEQIHADITSGDAGSPGTIDIGAGQTESEAYWRSADNTYLAPSDYYKRKTVVLDELLPGLPKIGNAIDIGCGDGKFTFQLAKHADQVVAYDIGPTLLQKARQSAESLGIKNVQFIVQDLDELAPLDKYDLISCMGVTSCIIDDLKLLSMLDKLPMMSRKGTLLLMIDSLSSEQDRLASDPNGYVAKYRAIEEYLHLIARRGFVLKTETLIKEVSEKSLINKLFVFEYRGSGARHE